MLTRPALLSFALLITSTSAIAQPPAGTGGSTMVATRHHIFVLHDGILFKFDQETLALIASVALDAARRSDVGEEMVDAEPIVEVAEEVVEAEPVPRVARPKDAGQAVERALEWLIMRQDEDGKWDADGFMKHDVDGRPSTGPGNATKDVGVTGLATLALLGNGSTLRTGPHREQLRKAVSWLRDQQQPNGLIGTNATHDFIYSHAIATLALSETYGLSRARQLKAAVQNAINYLEMHRNPYSVWRYQPRDNDNDTSVTTWALMAYASAQNFGLDVNGRAMQLVASWYDEVTDENGRAGYTKRGELSSRMPGDHSVRFPPKNGEALTAAALFGRFLLDQSPETTDIMHRSARLLAAKPPVWQQKHIDPYYWWFGTQAMYQMGGRYWQQWSKGLEDVVSHQRRDGNFSGSWDPIGVWDLDGGRVYSTALYALTLETVARIAELKR